MKAQHLIDKLEIQVSSNRGFRLHKHQRVNLCTVRVDPAFLFRPFKTELRHAKGKGW